MKADKAGFPLYFFRAISSAGQTWQRKASTQGRTQRRSIPRISPGAQPGCHER